MSYTLHPLTAEDRAGLEALYEASIRANAQGFIQDLSFHGNIYDLFSGYVAQGGAAIVLKEQGAVIGMGGLRPMDSQTAELCKLHLNTRYQGKGLGKYMLLHLLATAQDLGFKEIDLHVTATQAPAIGLYKKLGFSQWQQQDCLIEVGGKTEVYPTLFMRKALL